MRTAFSFFFHCFLLLSVPHQYHSAYVPISIERLARSTLPAHHHCSQQGISCKNPHLHEPPIKQIQKYFAVFQGQTVLSVSTHRQEFWSKWTLYLLALFLLSLLTAWAFLLSGFALCVNCVERAVRRGRKDIVDTTFTQVTTEVFMQKHASQTLQ